ncbi:GntP family gluconate:H+ symporter [Pseudomonas sp. SORGH_AS199]|jgi:GntP family gluconate:H+ symporter|uniref:GntP family permease n=1 Tax=Pseudomonas flavocrustae TaxID=2991719 RepID=A0ABT6ICX2_9PSED|nr:MULTISPECIES: GntP family permease [Pseudomonas]MBB2896831.1 GntP family gluconate:H+ symporter [Pseudomonas sp. AS2.8]MDH4762206.1 GntP family permease [Pseudomonas sp. CBMAI 2609]MDK8265359.1 GntP family permease [Pseudomonas oryzihabitans]MDQ7913182.1 GntP family permease [Pseudomonas sp. 102515]MDR6229549.1 GntP family gluconate:H+ symporter [Pseudomonas sp. SORGH_AS_0199]
MFGMDHNSFLLLDALVTIIGLVLLITKFKVHPFIALTIASGFLGLTSGMPVEKVMKSFQDGFGGVLGFVGILLGLGTMLGKLMADSGGADQIAQTLIRAFGIKRVHWAMMFAAFLVGIPLFFEIGFVLLAPLVFIVARRTGLSLVKLGIPLLAGLSAVHGLVPPHPGPLLAVGVFGADIGKTIFYGLLVGLPTAMIAGPLFGAWISKRIPGSANPELVAQIAQETDNRNLPGFGITVFTVLLPVILMLLKAFADIFFAADNHFRIWMDFIGHPITALLAALLLSFYSFGTACGFSREKIVKLLDQSLAPVAAIVLIVGAGGGFKQMLVASGVGEVIGNLAVQTQISPILLTWLVAAVIRVATGSATVATITGAGIVAPVVALIPGVNKELLVLAAGAGSVILSHVNDAGFWLVKQYFNMTVAETFKTWSMMETILSVVALAFIMLLSLFV